MEWLDTLGINQYSKTVPYRILPLVNGECYHIYNRGAARQPTFSSKRDYERFLSCLLYYRFNNSPFKLSRLLQISKNERDQILLNLESRQDFAIEIVAYCLMPNHFHILIKQITDKGISTFMKLVTDSYTRYYNTKHDRLGPLFQGAFKAVRIETNEQLIHVSRYIHLNPLVSYVVRDDELLYYPWSSLMDYLNGRHSFVNSQSVISNFKTSKNYQEFVLNQIDYGKELEKIKHLTLES